MQPDGTDLNPPGLSDHQQRAAVLLVSSITVQDVADQLGVHRTLQDKALATVERLLDGDNDGVALRGVPGPRGCMSPPAR